MSLYRNAKIYYFKEICSDYKVEHEITFDYEILLLSDDDMLRFYDKFEFKTEFYNIRELIEKHSDARLEISFVVGHTLDEAMVNLDKFLKGKEYINIGVTALYSELNGEIRIKLIMDYRNELI